MRIRILPAAALILILIAAAIAVISGPIDESGFTAEEVQSMAEIWAEALKTRDGEPRYELMSEQLKAEFIEEQKQRSDPWNFNIGVSSPWVTDYEIAVGEGTAEILYHLTDSTQALYDQREILHFGKENGRTVVIEAEELPNDWEGADYFVPAETAVYEFDGLLYLSGLSSMTFDYAESSMQGTRCTVGSALFEIDYREQDDYTLQEPKYLREAMSDDMVKAFEHSTMNEVSLSGYANRYRYTIYTSSGEKTNFHLYDLDGELWLSSYADNTADKSEIAMYIWKLK